MENNYPTGYSKRNWPKWIFIYLIIGTTVYGIIYLVVAINGGYGSQQYPEGYNMQINSDIPKTQNSADINNDKDLQSAVADLDASNVGQIDIGLNQNDEDGKTF